MALTKRRRKLWSIVLAGGDGHRTKEFVRRWLGYEKPKQFCTFVGTRSMLQHTLRDPQATVVIYPSDHLVQPEDAFIFAVDQAVRGSTLMGFGRSYSLRNRKARSRSTDGLSLDGLWGGQEKPRCGLWKHLLRNRMGPPLEKRCQPVACGTPWSSQRKPRSWSLGRTCVPEMMLLFERLKTTIDTVEELTVLNEIYETMPRRNFSSDLLQRAAGAACRDGNEDVL